MNQRGGTKTLEHSRWREEAEWDCGGEQGLECFGLHCGSWWIHDVLFCACFTPKTSALVGLLWNKLRVLAQKSI